MSLGDTGTSSSQHEAPSVLGMFDVCLGRSRDTLSAERNTHLSCEKASELFQNFVQTVDPMDKLLHIPTIETVFFTAIRDMEHTPPDIRSLIFAIYIASATSMSPDSAEVLFCKSKATALVEFQQSLSLAFSEANFPQKATLASLQALALFLVSSNLIS